MNIFQSVHMYYALEGLSTDLMVLSYCGLIALSKQEGKAFALLIFSPEHRRGTSRIGYARDNAVLSKVSYVGNTSDPAK